MSPLYEYECPDGHKHDRLRPISQSSEDALCPECGQVAKRIMSVYTYAIDWNSVLRKIKSEPAPNTATYDPKWDD